MGTTPDENKPVDDGAGVTVNFIRRPAHEPVEKQPLDEAMPSKKPAQPAQPVQASEPSLAEQISECRAGLNRLLSVGGNTQAQRQRLNELLVQQAALDAQQGHQQAMQQAAQQAADAERNQRIAAHEADLQGQREQRLADLKARFSMRHVAGHRLA